MKNAVVCVVLIAISSTIFALTLQEREVQEIENMKLLAQMGLPLPGSGIKIIPRSMLGLTSEEIRQGDKEMAEFRDKGYVNKDTNRPRELLKINQSFVKKNLMSVSPKTSDEYTGLSRNINQIKLAFKFPGLAEKKYFAVAGSSDIQVLAAAPKGGFHADKGGWSGASQFFIYKGIGVCSYAVMNVKASNTAAWLAQEDVTYTINNKATILMPVEGCDRSGYLYDVKWYDNDNFHELECANMKYSQEINEAVTNLAKHIDKT